MKRLLLALALAAAALPALAQPYGVPTGPVTSAQVVAALGYTPVNKAGDTMTGALGFSGTTNPGLVVNSLTTTQKNALASPAAGTIVYDSTLTRMQHYDGSAWHSFTRLDGDAMTGALSIVNSLAGSAATSSLALTPTWNTTGTPTALDLNLTDTASNAAALLLNLRVASTSQFKVTKGGGVTAAGAIVATGGLTTVDGRINQASGPTIDLRTANTVKLFQPDGTTPAALVSGAISVPTGAVQYMGSAGGTADALTATPGTALTAYTTGAFYIVKATAANATTTPTINISALGAKTIVKRASTALAASDIVNGANLLLVYDGTNMQLLNPVVN